MLSEQTPVVILAGGKGTRLKPYTTALPKPLVPVGDYPILDILLRQLGNQGFKRITLAVGHLAGLIRAYFKQGQDWGVNLEYAYETSPLGTAAPIARLPREERALLVLNGDLLTTLDFAQLVRFHYENRAVATIGTKRRTEPVEVTVLNPSRRVSAASRYGRRAAYSTIARPIEEVGFHYVCTVRKRPLSRPS